MRNVAIAATKLALGVALYGLIIVAARPWPTAAGTMLTFPLLNGLTLTLAQRRTLDVTAGMMLLMPAVNCALCVAYIALFLLLRPSDWLSLAAVGTAAAIWVVVIAILLARGVTISPARRLAYAVCCTLAMIVAMLSCLLVEPGASAPPVAFSGWQELIWQNRYRFGLFALSLVILIAVTDLRRGRARAAGDAPWAALIGALGGLPVVPLFGLYTIAGDDAKALAERVAVLRRMLTGVWFGPVVAIWFVLLLSAWLRRERGSGATRIGDFAGATVGWALGLAVIIVATIAIDRVGAR